MPSTPTTTSSSNANQLICLTISNALLIFSFCSSPATALPDEEPRPARSLTELLRDLPKEARPTTENGWDKYSLPKAQKWMSTNLPKRKIEFAMSLSQAPKARAVEGDDNGESVLRWKLTFVFDHQVSKVFGIDLAAAIGEDPKPRSVVTVIVDEKTARIAEKLKTGQKLKVTATILDAQTGRVWTIPGKRVPIVEIQAEDIKVIGFEDIP